MSLRFISEGNAPEEAKEAFHGKKHPRKGTGFRHRSGLMAAKPDALGKGGRREVDRGKKP